MTKTPPSFPGTCIDSSAFEAFHDGSWHGIDQIHIKDGHIGITLNGSGSLAEVNGDHLRMRSRRATSDDCSELLMDGAHVCVLSAHPAAMISDKDRRKSLPAMSWNDAKIISVKRLPHVNECACLFSVFINRSKFPITKQKSKDARRMEVVPIEKIAILQKLLEDPCGNGYHRWRSTEDCVSSSKSKLLSDTFGSEVAYLMVLSTLKGMNFELKMVQDKIVCCILDNDNGIANVSNPQVNGARHKINPESHGEMKIMRFQRCHGVRIYRRIEAITRPSIPEVKIPGIAIKVNHCSDDVSEDSDVEILHSQVGLRRFFHSDHASSHQSPDSYHSSNEDNKLDESDDEQPDTSAPDSSSSDSVAEVEATFTTGQQRKR